LSALSRRERPAKPEKKGGGEKNRTKSCEKKKKGEDDYIIARSNYRKNVKRVSKNRQFNNCYCFEFRMKGREYTQGLHFLTILTSLFFYDIFINFQ
jgi:hypothetical protein